MSVPGAGGRVERGSNGAAGAVWGAISMEGGGASGDVKASGTDGGCGATAGGGAGRTALRSTIGAGRLVGASGAQDNAAAAAIAMTPARRAA